MIRMGLSTALRMPEPEIRHTTSAQPTRMIKFHVRTRERPADGPSVVHLIDLAARQHQLFLTATMLTRGGTDAQFKWDSPAVEKAAGSSAEGSRGSKRSSDGIGKSRESERRFETSPHGQEPETSISCCAEENCGSSACSVGEVEGSTPQRVNGFGPVFHNSIHRYLFLRRKLH